MNCKSGEDPRPPDEIPSGVVEAFSRGLGSMSALLGKMTKDGVASPKGRTIDDTGVSSISNSLLLSGKMDGNPPSVALEERRNSNVSASNTKCAI